MEILKGAQWILQWILQCGGFFAVTDRDIVLRSTNSNFNKRGPCTLFFPSNIVSITIPCNGTVQELHNTGGILVFCK